MGRRVVTAAAAVTGGALWTVKAAAILAGAGQPPYLFELAPAVGTVPAVLVGGALSLLDERLLELPILLLGLAWLALAGIVLQDRRDTAGSARW